MEEAVENWEVNTWSFPDNEGGFDSTSYDIITEDAKWCGHGDMIWSVGGLALCWVAGKLKSHLQDKLWRGLWPGAVHRRDNASAVEPSCGWIDKKDSKKMAVIHWGMQMTLLPSSMKNSWTPHQSFYRKLWVLYNSGATGLSCLWIHKRWWY